MQRRTAALPVQPGGEIACRTSLKMSDYRDPEGERGDALRDRLRVVQRIAVDELVLVAGGNGPAVVSRDRNSAAVEQVRVHRKRGEWCQPSSPEK